MNHVNAIRSNDEYQCSHCGKSWDIHEEAPDCKMSIKTVEINAYKTIIYFGLSLLVPNNTFHIATNSNGAVYSFFREPERCDEYWDTHHTGFPKMYITNVNLHGLDWKETLREC